MDLNYTAKMYFNHCDGVLNNVIKMPYRGNKYLTWSEMGENNLSRNDQYETWHFIFVTSIAVFHQVSILFLRLIIEIIVTIPLDFYFNVWKFIKVHLYMIKKCWKLSKTLFVFNLFWLTWAEKAALGTRRNTPFHKENITKFEISRWN